MIFYAFQNIGFWGILGPPSYGIGATIRIGREMLCLPYVGFFLLAIARVCLYSECFHSFVSCCAKYITSFWGAKYITSVLDANYITSVLGATCITSVLGAKYVITVIKAQYIAIVLGAKYIKSVLGDKFIKILLCAQYIPGLLVAKYIKSGKEPALPFSS